MKLLSIIMTLVYAMYIEFLPNSHLNGIKKNKTSRGNFPFTSATVWVTHKIPETLRFVVISI